MKKLFMLFTLCATALLSTTALAVSPLDKDGNLNISGMDFSQGMTTPYSYEPRYNSRSEYTPTSGYRHPSTGWVDDCVEKGRPCHDTWEKIPASYSLTSTSVRHAPFYQQTDYTFNNNLSEFGKVITKSYYMPAYSLTGNHHYKIYCTNASSNPDSEWAWSCNCYCEGDVYTGVVSSGNAVCTYPAVVPEFTPTAIKLKNCRFSPHDGINTFRKEVV